MSDTPPPSRPSGNNPRIFFDGEDAQTFLGHLRAMASDCEETKSILRDRVGPLMDRMSVAERNIEQIRTRVNDQTTNRIDELERKIGIIIDDRVAIVALGRKVDSAIRLRWAVAILLVLATGTSVGGIIYTQRETPSWESPTR